MKAALSKPETLTWLPPERSALEEQYKYGYDFGMRLFENALDLLVREFEMAEIQEEMDLLSKSINRNSSAGTGFVDATKRMAELMKLARSEKAN